MTSKTTASRSFTASTAGRAAAFGLAALAGTASANHYGYWNDLNDYYLRISGMVDFDQSRGAIFSVPGLPNNGSMYCAPTSASNLMGFIERHGFESTPGVDGPGVRDWYNTFDTDAYADATNYIAQMGIDMSTSATGGTDTIGNGTPVVRDRLPQNKFDVLGLAYLPFWAPTVDVFANVIADGGIAMMCFGRWTVDTDSDLLSRGGGHCVSMTKIDKRAFMNYGAGRSVIQYTDPGSGGDNIFNQSAYAEAVQNIQDQTYFQNLGFLKFGTTFSRIQIAFNPNDQRHRLIDKMIAVLPKQAWSNWPQPNTLTVFSSSFKLGTPGGGGIAQQSFQAPNGAPIISAEFSPDRSFVVIQTAPTAGGSAELHAMLHRTGGTILLARDSSATPSAFLPDGTLLIAEGQELKRLRFAQNLGTPGAAPFTVAEQVERGVRRYDDIDFDQASRRFMARSSGDNVIIVGDLNGFHEIERTAAGDAALTAVAVPSFLNQVRRSRLAEGGTEALLLTSEGIFIFDLRTGNADRTPAIDTGSLITDFVVEGDTVVVATDGTLQEFRRTAAGGFERTTGAEASPFNGQRVGTMVGLSQSWNNYRPDLHSGPGFENIDPSELDRAAETGIDCIVDLVAPFEQLDVFDILEFFNLFGAQDPVSDIDQNGSYDVFDILGYFRLFGAGC